MIETSTATLAGLDQLEHAVQSDDQERRLGRRDGVLPPLEPAVLAIAGATVALLMVVAGRYGYARDELYFFQAARHMDWAYVDLPAFVPALARLSLAVFGQSLVGLRLFAALATGATLLLAALLAREFGGRRQAQVLSVLAAGTAPALLGAGHLFGPTVFDFVSWSALAFVLARIGRTGDSRLWACAGLVVGLGFENKHQVAAFAAVCVLGVVARKGLRREDFRWMLLGGVIALAAILPEIWWQAHHGWATFQFSSELSRKQGGLSFVWYYVTSQPVLINPVTLFVAWRGLVWLLQSDIATWRAFSFAYIVLTVFFAVTVGGHPYYTSPIYIVLFAAGGVAYEERWAAGRTRRRSLLFLSTVAVAIPVTLITLPILPLSAMTQAGLVNPIARGTIGWDQYLGTVSRVWRSLPGPEREQATIFTARYAEAAAINELGRRFDLPRAVSGHDDAWFWGPGNPSAKIVIAVAQDPHVSGDYESYLRRFFGEVDLVATIGTPAEGQYAPPNHFAGVSDEFGGHIWICRMPRLTWGQLWPQLRHYGPA